MFASERGADLIEELPAIFGHRVHPLDGDSIRDDTLGQDRLSKEICCV